MKTRLDLVAILTVTVLALAGIIVLAVLQLPIPEVLTGVAFAGAGALGMAANPLRTGNPPVGGPSSSEQTADLPAQRSTPAPSERRHLVRTDTGQSLHPRKASK